MRVLDTSTQTLVEFANPPDEYAILSHTWANEEVTFEDITGDKKYWKDGWDKIIHCCKLAASDGWQYVWIDTCCIDKSSSADLSEAINSMFTWYANASICYAYLADVSDLNLKAREQQITMSRWFTRGWTLQELIAPKFIIFLNRMWQEIGTRDSLASAIEKATQMTRTDLRNWKTCSLATKMSWAARRTTLRIEDEAYCLMGLFGINMPLLYGEGPKAFLRLQHEIIKTSDDESIFAWKGAIVPLLSVNQPSTAIKSRDKL